MSKDFLKEIFESEKKFYFYIIDLLAKEYGWSIEYIQNLELPEIAGLLKAIYDRQDIEDLISQVNVNRGMAGKIDSVRRKKKRKKENEMRNLQQLARLLGKKVKKVEKDNG